LKKVLLLKKLDSIEQATTQKNIELQIAWLKKKRKPLTIINERFKEYELEVVSLQKQINQLANNLTEQEKISVSTKIKTIKQNIKNSSAIIVQKMSTGYIAEIIERIKDSGYHFYEWLSRTQK
jgi:uncharacterized membrane protein YhiD involved in acid resistance